MDRIIELDADTAAIVDRRAAEQGLSASEFIVALVRRDGDAAPGEIDAVAELDRRWAAIEQGTPTVSEADVSRWLETWGTSSFEPWPNGR